MSTVMEKLAARRASAVKEPREIYGLIGPNSHGKSVTACSISKHFPSKLGPAEKPVLLEDTLGIYFDRGGYVGFQRLGFDLPMIDLSTIPEKSIDFDKAVKAAFKEAQEYIEAGLIKNVIIDTVTQYDNIITGYLGKMYANNDDKSGMWQAIRIKHSEFIQHLTRLDARVVLLFQPKVQMVLEDKKASKDRAAAKNLMSEDVGEPQTTGASRRYYKDVVSCCFPLIRKGNKTKGYTYKMYTDMEQGLWAKCRWPGVPHEVEPNLYKFLQEHAY